MTSTRVQPWRYESRSTRRRRERENFGRFGEMAAPLVQEGSAESLARADALARAPQTAERMASYSARLRWEAGQRLQQQTQQQAVPSPAEKKDDGGGGFLGKVKDVAEDVGGKTMDALGAVKEYGVDPVLGVLSGQTSVERVPILDANGKPTGRYYRPVHEGSKKWGPIDVGSFQRTAQSVKDFAKDPAGQYQEGRQAWDESIAAPENNRFVTTAVQTATDPTLYIAPGAVGGVASRIPTATRAGRAARTALTAPRSPIGALLEGAPGKTAVGIALGAGAGAQIAESTDVPLLSEGAERALLPIAGGFAGGAGIGAARMPTRAGVADALAQDAPVAALSMRTGAPEGYVANKPYGGRKVIPSTWKQGAGPQPLANERLWFHSTRNMSYSLPDPDMAVGTQTGITQGPGVYLAADPERSAGQYGNRTFITEFDGNVLDLTKPVRPEEPIVPNGPSWVDLATDLENRLRTYVSTIGITPRHDFSERVLNMAAQRAIGALARPDNGYAYRQALEELAEYTVKRARVAQRDVLERMQQFGQNTDRFALSNLLGRMEKELTGRFSGLAGRQDARQVGQGIVANLLADNGVDAVFHHSPRADGDVLIVLNGEKARVLGDVKNAPDVVKAGASWPDIKARGKKPAVKYVANRDGSAYDVLVNGESIGKVATNGRRWWAWRDEPGSRRTLRESPAMKTRLEATDWLYYDGDPLPWELFEKPRWDRKADITAYALQGETGGTAVRQAVSNAYGASTPMRVGMQVAAGAGFGALNPDDGESRLEGALKGAAFAGVRAAGMRQLGGAQAWAPVARAVENSAMNTESGAVRADMGVGTLRERVARKMAERGKSSAPTPEPVTTNGGFDLSKLEPTRLIATAYGQLPFLRERGIGQDPAWLVDAPDAYTADSILALRDITTDTKLPASARVSNRFWKTLSAVNPKFAGKLDDARVRQIAVAYRHNAERIGSVADLIANTAGRKAFEGLEWDDLGRARVNGELVPFVNANGVQIPGWHAGWSDILENPARYPELQALFTPERQAAFADLSSKLSRIVDASRGMGIRIEGQAEVGPGGMYIPRGRPVSASRELETAEFRGVGREGRRAGSTKERLFDSQAAAIAKGRAYPAPLEAIHQFVTENLTQQNATHAGNLLKRIEVDGKTLGDATVPDATVVELGALRKEIKPGQRVYRTMKAEKQRIDRDVRLTAKEQQRAHARWLELRDIVNDSTRTADERAAAAREAFIGARQQLNDAVSAVGEYAQKTAVATSERDLARGDLRGVVQRAQQLSKRMDAIEDEMRAKLDANATRQDIAGANVDAATDMMNAGMSLPMNALLKEAEKARLEADTIMQRAARETGRIERKLAALPFDDADARVAEARQAVAEAREKFGQSLRGGNGSVRTSAIEMAEAARDEARAAANIRGAMAEGASRELRREWRRRTDRALELVGRQTELGEKLAELGAKLEPLVERRKELLKQVAQARTLGRENNLRYAGEFNIEPLRGLKAPAPLVNAFNKYLSEPGQSTGAALFDLANNAFRTIGATADASRTMTIGLLGLADNPRRGLRGIGAGLRSAETHIPKTGVTAGNEFAIWDDLARLEREYRARGIDIPIEDAIAKDGLQVALSEQSLAGTARKGSFQERLSRLPGIRQADALYSAPGNFERVDRFYATLQKLKADGKDWSSPQARAASANAANLISGRASRGVLAPVMGEQASARVAFAGRWVESQFEVVANAILSGGIEGTEARASLMRMAAGGVALTVALNAALGNDTDFDARSPNFLRIRVGDRDYSLFGSWDSLVRGLVRVGKGSEQVATGDVGEGLSNIGSFGRSKLSPLPGIGYDVSAGGGENPVGEPALSPGNVLPAPFGLREVASITASTDYSDPSAIAALGLAGPATLLGVKSSEMTPRERLDEAAANTLNPATGERNTATSYFDSEPVVKQRVREENPELWNRYVNNGREAGKRSEAVKTELEAQQAASDAQFLAGEMTREDWISAMKDRRAELAARRKEIYGDKPMTQGDVKTPLDGYYFAIQEATDPDTGQTDWGAVDQWLGSQSASAQEYIDRNSGLGNTDLVRLYRKTTKAYYGLPKYRGYSDDEAYAIDAVYVEVRNTVQSAKDRAGMMRALRRMDIDPKVRRGVAARIYGTLQDTGAREKWKKAHPEAAMFLGNGKLQPGDIISVQAALSREKRRAA